MTVDGPSPGEVWIVSKPEIGPESWQRLGQEQPFIVTYVSRAYIGYVAGGDGIEPRTDKFHRGSFPWHEHCVRLWPPVPSWDELADTPLAAQGA